MYLQLKSEVEIKISDLWWHLCRKRWGTPRISEWLSPRPVSLLTGPQCPDMRHPAVSGQTVKRRGSQWFGRGVRILRGDRSPGGWGLISWCPDAELRISGKPSMHFQFYVVLTVQCAYRTHEWVRIQVAGMAFYNAKRAQVSQPNGECRKLFCGILSFILSLNRLCHCFFNDCQVSRSCHS